MPRPLRPTPETPPADGGAPHELALEDLVGGSYFAIGEHMFMAATMNLLTKASVPKFPGEDPLRDMDEIDLRLVHAWWKCPND